MRRTTQDSTCQPGQTLILAQRHAACNQTTGCVSNNFRIPADLNSPLPRTGWLGILQSALVRHKRKNAVTRNISADKTSPAIAHQEKFSRKPKTPPKAGLDGAPLYFSDCA
jgi:hypothetical protein